MFNLPFADILPKSVVAAAVLWGGTHYFIAGPAIAARVAKIDHLGACELAIKTRAIAATKRRAEELPPPDVDLGRDFLAEQLRRILNSPRMRDGLVGAGDSFGLGEATDKLLGQYEQGRQAAENAYRNSVERLNEESATALAKAGSRCGCLADAAISETRTEWAIYSGTIGLFRPAALADFGNTMMEADGAGRCAAIQTVTP